MTPFIHGDFLLKTRTARALYHGHAAGLPVIDYHCHLDPRILAEDRPFKNITRLWIAGDPYKHRAMRIAGVPERFITGEAADREKFDHWAATVPLTLGNPLFHWTALELKRFFGIDELLTPDSAARIWDACNAMLASPEFTPRQLIARSNVECLCTSDGILDDLRHHASLVQSSLATRVLPSLRADDILAVGSNHYPEWLNQLSAATGIAIDSFDAFCRVVCLHLDHFGQLGCLLSDHGLDEFIYFNPGERAAALFEKCLSAQSLDFQESFELKSAILHFLGLEYARRGWAMQLHLGAFRQTSSRLRQLAGPAGGYAAIGRASHIESLCRFLNDLEKESALPRTILYSLNPADNAALATLTGSFAEDGVRGKIQFGPAWWYNDHLLGIRSQLETLASYGLLAAFIGMTTDSRSLLSMTRHEYFRRVLCDWLGDQAEAGLLPADEQLLGRLVRAACYENPRQWLFPTKD